VRVEGPRPGGHARAFSQAVRARVLACAAAVACGLFGPGAHGAEPESAAIHVLVFVEGEPTPRVGARVELDMGTAAAQAVTTDGFGLAMADVAPGRHTLRVEAADGSGLALEAPPVFVEPGHVLELIVTLSPDPRRASVDTEDPRALIADPTQTAAAATGAEALPVETGTVRGVVVSLESRKALRSVQVIVRGATVEARTDATGAFTLELPATAWALSFVHPEHSPLTREPVVVRPGETTTLEVALPPAALSLAEFVVSAPYIAGSVSSVLDAKRDAASVNEVIGAEQIARAGDSDAGSALRRVTGLTLIGGKYVYVRGMGERYSSTLLNRAQMPSPEPERRVVPLDMFPAAILRSVTIQKTYSPDLPGEFGGGTILIETLGSPETFIAGLSLSSGGNTETTFRSLPGYQGGALDFLGFDDGTRALPDDVARASDDQKLLPGDRFSEGGYTPEQLQQFGRLMPNKWAVGDSTVLPNLGLSGIIGTPFRLAGRPGGVLFSAGWGQDWQGQQATRRYLLVGEAGALEVGNEYRFRQLQREVTLNSILDLAWSPAENHNLGATTVINRKSIDEAREFTGVNRNVQQDIRVSRLRWIEQTLFSQQVRGDHTFPDADRLKLDWRYAWSLALRYEPDLREYRYDFNPTVGKFLLNNLLPDGNWRRYNNVTDNTHDVAFDLLWPLASYMGNEAKLKAGPNFVIRQRDSNLRIYKFEALGSRAQSADVLAQGPEQVFAPANIGPDGFQLEEITRGTDNYRASQQIFAGYAMFESQLGIPQLTLSTGVRLEHSRQRVETFELFSADNVPIVAQLDNLDVLPAATVSWGFRDDMQLRGAFGRTVSRPDFRELSPAVFNDVVGGRAIRGNENLRRATILNYDLRWEWYPTARETLAVAAFYKQFNDPIELVVVPGSQPVSTFANADGAFNTGVELEFRKHLGFFDRDVPELEGLYVAGNVSWIFSRIRLGENAGIQTNPERPLQGQSPWIVNAQLGYESEKSGTNVTVLYNVAGPYIAEVGANQAPDIYAEPVHQLDLVAQQSLGYGLTLRVKARNLLDFPVVRTQGTFEQERYLVGRSFSLSLGWTY
jgi:outer membrane receptor protein involved in Fe transport